jgi:putative hydrolase of the HAD superfamily
MCPGASSGWKGRYVGERSLLLWDVGGVVLSNAWDLGARRAAVTRFGLDPAEFESRHQQVVAAFETGQIDLRTYLAETVFYKPRSFGPPDFEQFMRDRSTANSPTLTRAIALRRQGKFLMAALNNESRELNDYRIRTFHLQEAFELFLSSCYTGLRKPDPAAYRYALRLTQREPRDVVFLDDRPENVQVAAALGLGTILVKDPEQLVVELRHFGIAAD